MGSWLRARCARKRRAATIAHRTMRVEALPEPQPPSWLEHPDLYVLEVSRAGRVLSVNDALLAAIGRDRDELVGKVFHERFVPAAEQSALAETWRRPLVTGEPVVAEHELLTTDGRTLVVRWRVSVARDVDVDRVLAVGVDVTDRVRAERARQSSDVELQGVLDNLPDGYVRSGADGRIVFVNPAAVRMHGYASREEMLGLPVEELHGDPESSRRVLEALRRRGRVDDHVGVGRRKDGSTFVLSLSLQRVRNERGEVVATEGVARDITARAQAEAQAAKLRANLVVLIESTDDLVCSVDLERRLLGFNAAMARHFLQSYGTSARVGVSLDALMPPERLARWVDLIRETVSSGRRDVEYDLPDGRVLDLTLHVVKEGGRPFGVSLVGKDITQRRRADRALRDREALLRGILDNLQDAFFRTGPEGRFTMVSPSAAEMFGYGSPEELIGVAAVSVWVNPAERAILVDDLGIQELHDARVEFRRRDGTPFWVSLNVRRHHDESGAYLGVEGFVRDITERKRMEDELEESRANLSALIESTRDLVWSVDLEGRLLTFNAAFEEHLLAHHGVPARTGLSVHENLPPDRAARWLDYYARTIRDGHFRGDHQLIDGRLLDLSLSPMLRDGAPFGISIFGKDATERKRAERRVRDLAAIVEQSSDQVVIASMDGIIRYVNPALAAEVGGDTSGVVGHHYSTVQRRLGLAAMDVSGLPDLREGVWQGRHETLDLAGRRRVFDVTITPIKDDAAQVIGSAAVRREVTRQVDAEARQEQAQRLEAMGTLAAGIAHDFNNILGAILGYVDLAEGATSSSEQVECFGEVRLAARRAVDLVRHILDFSRMTRAEARAVEPRMIIKEAMKLMRAATPATISIETRLESGALVLVDPGEIHRILINLCTNAVVAMQDSGGVLEVRLDEVVRDTPPGGAARFVRLIVKDSGCGISDEHKARIFEPFFTTRAGKGGTGMGLHVVDSIVRARSGSIAVTSTPGEGATFEVLLPVTAHQEPPASDDGEPALPGTEHVLVVDDEPPIADSLGRSLQRLGYRVTVCTRSMEALARILQVACGIDVVVSDVTMPEMTGHQLAERVRRLRPDIPVILCSGFSEGADDLCAREAGDHACLRKPVAARQLSRVIRRVLDGRRACSR